MQTFVLQELSAADILSVPIADVSSSAGAAAKSAIKAAKSYSYDSASASKIGAPLPDFLLRFAELYP
jgi:hypothetical protein